MEGGEEPVKETNRSQWGWRKTIGQSGSHMKNLFQVEQLLSHIIPLWNQNKANNKTNKKPYLFLVKKIIVSVIFIFQYNNYKTIRSFCINYTNQILNTRVETTQRFNHNIRNSKLSEYNNLLFNSFTSCFYENRNLYDSFNTDLLYVYRNNHYIWQFSFDSVDIK